MNRRPRPQPQPPVPPAPLRAAERALEHITGRAQAWMPGMLALAGVLLLVLASQWPVQALSGFRLDDLHRTGPAVAVLGLLLCGGSVAALRSLRGGAAAPAPLSAVRQAVRQAVNLWGLGGVPRPRGRALLVEPVVLALVCCCALTRAALKLLPGSAGSSAGDPRFAAAAAAGPLGTVVFCMLGPGLTEELVFRGPVVVAARLGVPRRWLAPLMVASSGAFGASHLTYSLVNAVATATWGAVLAGWAARRCSLWPVVLAHGLYDVYAFLLQQHLP